MSTLLYDEHPLIVNPTLATLIGLNEAIILQQVHYWLEIEQKSQNKDVIITHFHDNRWWVYNTYDQWQEQFPFWSLSTIKRSIAKLEKQGLLLNGRYNKYGYDRTKWYSINYEMIETLDISHCVNMTQSNVSNRTKGKGQCDTTNTIDYTNTSIKDFRYNRSIPKRNTTHTFSLDIVYKQIDKVCDTDSTYDRDDIKNIFRYYFIQYRRMFGKDHPKMTTKNISDIIHRYYHESELSDYFDFDSITDMIDIHFQRDYGEDIDYNINHFMTSGILDRLAYEVGI